jgi:hypothetical protein
MAERPSPLWVRSGLNNNKLTGSVPSSLSALTKLTFLCVPRHHSAFARAAGEGRIGRLCSERGMSGGIEPGRCGSRAVAVLSEGTLARDVTKEYSRGTPPMGTVRGVPKGHCAVGAARYGAERPSPFWVCSWLNNNKLTGSVPSSLSALIILESLCVRPSSQRRLRVWPRRVGSVGSAPSARRAAVGGCMSGARSRRCGCRPARCSTFAVLALRGTRGSLVLNPPP